MPANKKKIATLAVRLSIVSAAAVLIVLVAAPLLGPCWHLVHGDAISFAGQRVPVPRGFYVQQSPTRATMWRQSFGIPFFNVPYGHISLFSRSSEDGFLFGRDYNGFKSGLTQDATERGYKLTSEQIVGAGKDAAYCLKFKPLAAGSGTLLRCAVEKSPLVVFYEGDSRYLPDVLATLHGVTR